MPIILAPGRLRKEDHPEFKANLSYIFSFYSVRETLTQKSSPGIQLRGKTHA